MILSLSLTKGCESELTPPDESSHRSNRNYSETATTTPARFLAAPGVFMRMTPNRYTSSLQSRSSRQALIAASNSGSPKAQAASGHLVKTSLVHNIGAGVRRVSSCCRCKRIRHFILVCKKGWPELHHFHSLRGLHSSTGSISQTLGSMSTVSTRNFPPSARSSKTIAPCSTTGGALTTRRRRTGAVPKLTNVWALSAEGISGISTTCSVIWTLGTCTTWSTGTGATYSITGSGAACRSGAGVKFSAQVGWTSSTSPSVVATTISAQKASHETEVR